MEVSSGTVWICITIFVLLNICNVETNNDNFGISKSLDKSVANISMISENTVDGAERKHVSENSGADVDPLTQAKAVEEGLKSFLKNAIKQILPILMNSNVGSSVSRNCTRSIAKYISALRATKVWAIKMLDATSKLPAGILSGTQGDFGSFDECLEITVPTKHGDEEFRGAYCTIEAKPHVAPPPRNFSLARHLQAGPHETVSAEILNSLAVFRFQFGVCIPSACTIDDAQIIANSVGNSMNVGIRIPKCHVKEMTKLEAIHISMIVILVLLVLLVVTGTTLDIKSEIKHEKEKRSDTGRSILLAFSIVKNYKKLMMLSSGPRELQALHGMKALTIAWVILGHVYSWPNFRLVGSTLKMGVAMNDFGATLLTNSWLCVDSFFFLSGLLLSYSCIPYMKKTEGKLSIPKYILRRYIRLTPSTLVVMGLIFFIPLITSGPFLYEKIDREIESCRSRWWLNLLYINNWFSVEEICVHTTWYLAADFQLYILSLLVLFPFYRSVLFGYFTIGLGLLTSILAIGTMTYWHNLPPVISLGSADEKLVMDTVNIVYIKTFTHMGPYFIGLLTGHLLLKYKDAKMSKRACWLCWCLSVFSSLGSICGVYQWNIGYPPNLIWTCLYAAVHRITFIMGVAWVTFACATGRAGLVNWFLSSYAFVPLSRLTFTTYLVHATVVWIRKGSERERVHYSHYNFVYEWIADWFLSVLLALPLHLLVEAPVSNLERLIFSGAVNKDKLENFQNTEPKTRESALTSSTVTSQKNCTEVVQLKSVQVLDHNILNGWQMKGL